MAGDWIKMRIDLDRDPAVFRLASILGIDRFSVVGRLLSFWGWVNQHSVDGVVDVYKTSVDAAGSSAAVIDHVAHCPGFGAALAEVGWLVVTRGGFRVPSYDRYNNESAKKRVATTAKSLSQARWRAKQQLAAVVAAVDLSEISPRDLKEAPREEKRRVEKSREEEKTEDPPTPPGGGSTAAGSPSRNRTHVEPSRRKSRADEAVPDGFAEFWQAYPNPKDKPAAIRAFVKLSPGPDLLVKIVGAIVIQKTWLMWTRDDGRYVPYPATWLNGRRWEDQPVSLPPPDLPKRHYDVID